jgi:hypothetical protein
VFFRDSVKIVKTMSVIHRKNHFPARISLLGLLTLTAIVGGFGARNTMQSWDSGSSLRAERDRNLEQQIDDIKQKGIIADTYAEHGYKQATCGTTLARFVFDASKDPYQQLNDWGFDWNTPEFNTERWYPLFDGTSQLFGAIRVENGQQRLVTLAEAPKLDQGAICNQNQLVP